MIKRDQFETLLYHQRLAHKSWSDKAFVWGKPPSPELSELVWELLVLYGDAVDCFGTYREDIYKTAYELATKALESMPINQVLTVYRDYLLDSMLDYAEQSSLEQCRPLILFTNTLSTAYSEAHSDTLKRTIRHRRTESLSNELKLAKQIQQQLLPKVIPRIDGFDFAGRLAPAAEIGGDYWSIKYYENDGRVTLKLADISGHGIAAATLVAAVKFISGGYYRGSKSASEVMWQTNRVLVKETPHDILITMVYGWLYPQTHELDLVNAGHAPAFICHDGVCTDIPPTGPVLGVTDNADYPETRYQLKKGDIVFLGSDGIIEAGVGERFGSERLKQLVSQNRNKSADDIADSVLKAVFDFAKPHDDVSLLILKVKGDH